MLRWPSPPRCDTSTAVKGDLPFLPNLDWGALSASETKHNATAQPAGFVAAWAGKARRGSVSQASQQFLAIFQKQCSQNCECWHMLFWWSQPTPPPRYLRCNTRPCHFTVQGVSCTKAEEGRVEIQLAWMALLAFRPSNGNWLLHTFKIPASFSDSRSFLEGFRPYRLALALRLFISLCRTATQQRSWKESLVPWGLLGCCHSLSLEVVDMNQCLRDAFLIMRHLSVRCC